ncbi:MAG: hypothetical protein H7Y89_18030 [Steroidobacteraceae bacterium]|nr:hypothetical protein [Steroidobacteraceae bacterium]
MKRLSLLLLASLCAVSAFATTYVRVEKDGSKTYSDRPIPGGQPVELATAQTYSSPTTSSAFPSQVPREQQLLDQMDDFRYSACALQPANDTSYTNPESVSVSLSLTPGLIPDHSVVVTVDGQPIPGGPNAMGATLTTVYRGTHTVAAIVRNRYGKTMCQATSRFHVIRPSLNSPTRRR